MPKHLLHDLRVLPTFEHQCGKGVPQKIADNAVRSEGHPAFSPDGTKIAYSGFSADSGEGGIFAVNSDGSGTPTRLITDPVQAANPVWSHDGTKIAFMSERDGNLNIYLMNSDGSNQKRLTKRNGEDDFPSFSLDDTKIAFSSSRRSAHEIYVMKAKPESKRNRPRNLTHTPASDIQPTFSPDGTKIAFTTSRDAQAGFLSEIYTMNASDGSEQTALTKSAGSDEQPNWGVFVS